MINRSNLVFNIINFLNGENWRKLQTLVQEIQYWDRKKIKEYQFSQFKKILEHAYNNVPFYTNLYKSHNISPKDIISFNDISKLPIIGKDIINSKRNEILSKDWKKFKPRKRQTGGTTGLAFKFYNDFTTWSLGWAGKVDFFSRADFALASEKLGVLAGGSLLPQTKGSIKNRVWRWSLNYHSMPISHMDDQILEKYVKEIEINSIKYLRGYPTAIYTLAKYLNKNDRRLKLKAVFTTAEMLYPHHRKLFKKIFGCETFNEYGSGDGCGGAYECEFHEGLHLASQISIDSVVDKQGIELGDGEQGELVFTSLFNYAMPMIRYKPGDLAIKSSKECPCGRKTKLLSKIIGRSSDLIELSNGRKINGLSIPFEEWTESIEKFQIVQTDLDKVELNIIPTDLFTDKDFISAENVMRFHCGEGVHIQINLVDNIKTPVSNKFRYVISRINFDEKEKI